MLKICLIHSFYKIINYQKIPQDFVFFYKKFPDFLWIYQDYVIQDESKKNFEKKFRKIIKNKFCTNIQLEVGHFFI